MDYITDTNLIENRLRVTRNPPFVISNEMYFLAFFSSCCIDLARTFLNMRPFLSTEGSLFKNPQLSNRIVYYTIKTISFIIYK